MSSLSRPDLLDLVVRPAAEDVNMEEVEDLRPSKRKIVYTEVLPLSLHAFILSTEVKILMKHMWFLPVLCSLFFSSISPCLRLLLVCIAVYTIKENLE